MHWKPRIVIAGILVAAAMTLTYFGVNHFIQSIGWLAAGFLFGTSQVSTK